MILTAGNILNFQQRDLHQKEIEKFYNTIFLKLFKSPKIHNFTSIKFFNQNWSF